MFAVMQALSTFRTEVRHQSSHPVHRAVSAFALLTASHSFRATLKAWSATSRIDKAGSLVSARVASSPLGPPVVSFSGLRSDTREVNSE